MDVLHDYKNKETTARQAIASIKLGQRVYVDSGCSEPQLLTSELVKVQNELVDTHIFHFLTIGQNKFFDERSESRFRHDTFFIGENMRHAVWDGLVDYTPFLLSDVPRLFSSRRIPIDVALIQCTPPDANGNCSLGVNVDIVKAVVENAARVIAEINPAMPRTRGDSLIHMDQIDAYLESDKALMEHFFDPPTDRDKQIAKNVADLILDRSTIQTGVGRVPFLVMDYLTEKEDLGIHSEVVFDGLVSLVDSGAVTCQKKGFKPGVITTSFALGSKELFDFLDDNSFVEFYPTDIINSPHNIAQNRRQVSINSALLVDLTGQVASTSIGTRYYSGFGGQVDFTRGAALAPEGRPIITLPSVTDDGKKTRIVPFLEPGTSVTINQAEVHYIVTEYGVAYLYGKNLRERALALISVAHPKFRKWLLEEAKMLNYVYQDQKLPVDDQGNSVLYPDQYEIWQEFRDGRELFIRPIKFTDERQIQELFYSLDEKSRYYRFFSAMRFFGHERAQDYVITDYRDKMIIVATDRDRKEPEREQIVAAAAFIKDKNSNFAEISMEVHKDYRRLGIATFFLEYLERIAQENGIIGFRGEILAENRQMIQLIKRVPHDVDTRFEESTFIFKYKFD